MKVDNVKEASEAVIRLYENAKLKEETIVFQGTKMYTADLMRGELQKNMKNYLRNW